jgi:hypothetical protein
MKRLIVLLLVSASAMLYGCIMDSEEAKHVDAMLIGKWHVAGVPSRRIEFKTDNTYATSYLWPSGTYSAQYGDLVLNYKDTSGKKQTKHMQYAMSDTLLVLSDEEGGTKFDRFK